MVSRSCAAPLSIAYQKWSPVPLAQMLVVISVKEGKMPLTFSVVCKTNNSFWERDSYAGKIHLIQNSAEKCNYAGMSQILRNPEQERKKKTKSRAETRRRSGQFLNIKAWKYLISIRPAIHGPSSLFYQLHILMQCLVGVCWCCLGLVTWTLHPSPLAWSISCQVKSKLAEFPIQYLMMHIVSHRCPWMMIIKGRILTVWNKCICL